MLDHFWWSDVGKAHCCAKFSLFCTFWTVYSVNSSCVNFARIRLQLMESFIQSAVLSSFFLFKQVTRHSVFMKHQSGINVQKSIKQLKALLSQTHLFGDVINNNRNIDQDIWCVFDDDYSWWCWWWHLENYEIIFLSCEVLCTTFLLEGAINKTWFDLI